ncbi:hypothetical protein E2320_012930 [Naja naja]|nr:hypothetical protein E2320_012930 [Naja naja]
MEQMDCKPYQPLSKAKHEMDLAYTSSSDESEDGRKARQSYESRETLNEFGQDLRLNYNSHNLTGKGVDESTQAQGFVGKHGHLSRKMEMEAGVAKLKLRAQEAGRNQL